MAQSTSTEQVDIRTAVAVRQLIRLATTGELPGSEDTMIGEVGTELRRRWRVAHGRLEWAALALPDERDRAWCSVMAQLVGRFVEDLEQLGDTP